MTHYEDISSPPRHVAIIMDGNGRWAERRGLPRTAGHRHGVEAVRRIVRTARDMGVDYLTLYSFSTENWARPKAEISELFSLLKFFIRRDLAELHHSNVRVVVIGQRAGLPSEIDKLLSEAERLTGGNTGQTLIIAFNYGSRDEIVAAVKVMVKTAIARGLRPEDIDEPLFSSQLMTAGIPDPDLVIRTSGEKRLSNFLLWQAAYSEFVFSDVLWPDFSAADFGAALREYQSRRRRYGGLDAQRSRETGS